MSSVSANLIPATQTPQRHPGVSQARNPWLALALLALADFMVILDASVVNVALPSIGRSLHLSPGGLSWVVNAYVLTFGGLLLLGGRLADLLGRRRLFEIGLVVFALASLVGGLAQTEVQLVAARAVQGLGAALLAPAALSLVAATFREGSPRNKAMGIWGAVAGSGAAAGVLLGGVLTSTLGWRWVLFINVPIGILAAAVAPSLVGESRATDGGRSFDLFGALAVTGALSALVYGLVEAPTAGWASAQTTALLAVAAVLAVAFVAVEQHADHPIVPFRVFRNAAVSAANATMVLVGASVLSLFFVLSLYMQQVLHYSALRAGVSQLPLAGAIIVFAGLAPRLLSRLGGRRVLLGGISLLAGGLAWFSQISADGTFLSAVLGPSLLVAAGLGLAFVVLTTASVSGVKENESGLASGLINTSQQLGGSLGLAIIITLATSRTASALHSGTHSLPSVADALTDGYRLALLGATGFACLALIVIFVMGRSVLVRSTLPPVPGVMSRP